ncbi:MAG: fumarylacetoacetate hydrolase family protein [Nocardioidaceae bacterium]|nr:fumarylacetoacetate hydrolase family protein [Nocardioidaceae bacterium]
MRIARFSTNGDPRFGVVGDDAGTAVVGVLEGDPLHSRLRLSGEKLRLDAVRLLAPVLPRSKVVGIGRNYAAHAAEMGNDPPQQPLVFFKPNTSVVGPHDAIVYPTQTRSLHFEGELAVVIKRICRDVDVSDVPKVVYGYTVGNDVTARDLQERDGQWARAKGFDSFCPLGPWIETELDVGDLAVTTTLNGERRQDGRTAQMIFDVPTLVSYVSSFTTLLPGDVILTGTPAGVGPMEAGDEVAVTVEGIGTLANPVVARG